jgi:hypothetical protein
MPGLPEGESMRCKPLLGFAVSAARCSNPMVVLITITQDEPCCLELPVEGQRRCFVEKRFSKCRIALNALNHRLLEIWRQCRGVRHVPLLLSALLATAFSRASYLANDSSAR